MKVNKFAACYPIETDVVNAIADDMRKHGFDHSHPVTIHKYTSEIIDGRTRLAAAKLAGIEPVFQRRAFEDDQEIAAFVQRCNDKRRGSMTKYQRLVHAVMWAEASGLEHPSNYALRQLSGFATYAEVEQALQISCSEEHDDIWEGRRAFVARRNCAPVAAPEPTPVRDWVQPTYEAPADYAPASSNERGRRYVVIPDTQVEPGVPLAHFRWIGKYIAEKEPYGVIHLGDHFDLPSLSSYDRGTTSAEGKRLSSDIAAGKLALRILDDAMGDFRPQVKVMLTGNHEERLMRHVRANPHLEGQLGYADLGREEFGWSCPDFLEPVEFDGVRYCHYFVRNAKGNVVQSRRGMPSARAQVDREATSVISGHLQGLDPATKPLQDRMLWSFIAGSCYLHNPRYLTAQGSTYWRGILVLNSTKEGQFSPWCVDLDYLCWRYEGRSLGEFMANAKDSEKLRAVG